MEKEGVRRSVDRVGGEGGCEAYSGQSGRRRRV